MNVPLALADDTRYIVGCLNHERVREIGIRVGRHFDRRPAECSFTELGRSGHAELLYHTKTASAIGAIMITRPSFYTTFYDNIFVRVFPGIGGILMYPYSGHYPPSIGPPFKPCLKLTPSFG